MDDSEINKIFFAHLSKKKRPTRKEKIKQTDAVKFVIDKVRQQIKEALKQTNKDPFPI